MLPPWLPQILNLDGTWEDALGKLYRIFQLDFVQGHPKFQGNPLIWDKRKLDGKYDEGFWHLISKNDCYLGDRIPDYRRAERLPWCAPTIVNCPNVAVTVWDYLEGRGRIRTYLWLHSCDYVIILEKRKAPFFLVTAYHIDGASTRRSLEKKYKKRVA